MKDLLKKGIVLGIGTTFIVQNKLQKMVEKILIQNKIDPNEAKKSAEEFYNLIERRLNEVSEKFLCPRHIKEIKERLTKIEQEMAKIKT